MSPSVYQVIVVGVYIAAYCDRVSVRVDYQEHGLDSVTDPR